LAIVKFIQELSLVRSEITVVYNVVKDIELQ